MVERIQLLLAHNWDIAHSHQLMLHDANHGHGERVKIWIEFGANPNATNDIGQTALHLFAARGTGRDAIRALVNAGSDIHATDHEGQTALDLATKATRQTATEELLRPSAKSKSP